MSPLCHDGVICVWSTAHLHVSLQDTRWEDAAAILDAWLERSISIPGAKAS